MLCRGEGLVRNDSEELGGAKNHVITSYFLSTDDETRVHLGEGPDYINANFVNVSKLVAWSSHVEYHAWFRTALLRM